MRIILFSLLFLFLTAHGFTQVETEGDSLKTRTLPELTVVGSGSKSDIHQLPQIVGTQIYAAKKSSLVVMDNVHGNIVSNTMRQVLAKVPGVFVWESDGSGLQINVAARGLSPNRSWEFNVRQNGFDIAADPYGYPEAYYNPQLQSVQRIEVVRGHGSLQYGPQLGGMINYILKNGSEFAKAFQVETNQTTGSNGLFNSFNALGGKTKKINYYVFYDWRQGDGWRKNNTFNSHTFSGSFTYKINSRVNITTEVTRWTSLAKQPGGLTDAQFRTDARQSVRARNWFELQWLTSGITLDYAINLNQKLNIKLFSIVADRGSLGFTPKEGIVMPDTIHSKTGTYANRTVDLDRYRNYGMEARYLLHYKLGQQLSSLSTGIRLYQGGTNRFRGGVGSTGVDFTLQREPNTLWTADIHYESSNVALFTENLFQITQRFLIVPGFRYEYITAQASGYNSLANNNPVYIQNQSRSRNILLLGIGTEYALSRSTILYANATQSYRPVQFGDLTAAPTTDVIDQNLTDASGLNIDIGYRGTYSNHLKFDVSAFYLDYQNRIGTLKQQRADGNFYNFRTNVGSSSTKGFEAFVEASVSHFLSMPKNTGNISVFGSYAYNDARYGSFKVVSEVNSTLVETNYRNKQVEYAPENIVRTGITYDYKNFFITGQTSYTDQVFADANNTVAPSNNGQNGLIPAYTVYDVSAGYNHKSGIKVRAGINNVTNEIYFTRRSGGYPGPGLLPADGRTAFVSIGYVMN
jgi:Fe(3+) dicitrate transport protein